MVKCADCGFLAIRAQADGAMRGANTHYRTEGYQGYQTDQVLPVPHCFVRAHSIHLEPLVAGGEVRAVEAESVLKLYNEAEEDVTDEAVLGIIKRERECSSFTPWLGEGWTPKEHQEIQERRWLLEWQQGQRAEDRRWRIIEILVIGLLATLMAGGFTVLGAFIERGSFP